MNKHSIKGKMESPTFEERVSLVAIQMFALKALKKSLQNLLLSLLDKYGLLLLWEGCCYQKSLNKTCGTSQHRPDASEFF